MKSIAWIARPLVCMGQVVIQACNPNRLTDADLTGLALRMAVIMQTIEMPRAEGRLLPADLFDDLDTLESILIHGHAFLPKYHSPARLVEWLPLVALFGEYYGLAGRGPIEVAPQYYEEECLRYGIIPYTPGDASDSDAS